MELSNKMYVLFCELGDPTFMGIFISEELALDAITSEIMMMDRLRKVLEKVDIKWQQLRYDNKEKFLDLLNEYFKITLRSVTVGDLDPLNNRYYRNLG